MIGKVLCILELAQAIVTHARKYGVILLSTCKSIHSIKPILKLNVHAVINSNNYNMYKEEYDFDNIDYVCFDNTNSLAPEAIELKLQVPIVYKACLTCNVALQMEGKLYTKFISIYVDDDISKAHLLSILDSCKYEYVFVRVISLLFKLKTPKFTTIVTRSNNQNMCFDIRHKKRIIGAYSNEFGEMVITGWECIPGDMSISFDNMCFRRGVQSSNDLRNLVESNKRVDMLHIPCYILNSTSYIVRSRIICVELKTDTLYIGKNILCKKVEFAIREWQPFSHVIIDNGCEYSINIPTHDVGDHHPINLLCDGTNLLVHLNDNTIVLINSTKYIPSKYRAKFTHNINYIDDDITKDNHRYIISKYLYNKQRMIISDVESGITNFTHVYACGWGGDTIHICDINTPNYMLRLIIDDPPKQSIIINISDSIIHNSLSILVFGGCFCDEATIIISTTHGISNIPSITIEYVGIIKCTTSIRGKTTTLYHDTVDENVTMYGSIMQSLNDHDED